MKNLKVKWLIAVVIGIVDFVFVKYVSEWLLSVTEAGSSSKTRVHNILGLAIIIMVASLTCYVLMMYAYKNLLPKHLFTEKSYVENKKFFCKDILVLTLNLIGMFGILTLILSYGGISDGTDPDTFQLVDNLKLSGLFGFGELVALKILKDTI